MTVATTAVTVVTALAATVAMAATAAIAVVENAQEAVKSDAFFPRSRILSHCLTSSIPSYLFIMEHPYYQATLITTSKVGRRFIYRKRVLLKNKLPPAEMKYNDAVSISDLLDVLDN